MAHIVLIGATGDVGRGIAAALLDRGHDLIAVGRSQEKLQQLKKDLNAGARFHAVPGSLESDKAAAQLLQTIQVQFGQIEGVVVSVNGPRETFDIITHTSDAFTALIAQDLTTHFTALRTFLPAIAPEGVFLGIGGGSADFILERGTHMSVAQAGLRMLYRGFAQERAENPVHIRELIVASVVNSVSTQKFAKPEWVTAREIGDLVAAILAEPEAFEGPIWRISRRDESGKPAISSENGTRVQNFRT